MPNRSVRSLTKDGHSNRHSLTDGTSKTGDPGQPMATQIRITANKGRIFLWLIVPL